MMRGSVLVLALLIFSMLALVVAGLASTAGLQLAIAHSEREGGAARALARAGLERARYELEGDAGWTGTPGEVRHDVEAGYTVSVTRSAAPPWPIAVTITSVGRVMARKVTQVATGVLRPYHGTVAVSSIGGPIRAATQLGDILEIAGDVHVSDPSGPAIDPTASVRVQGAIYDEGLHTLPSSCAETGYFARRRPRPLPAVDLAALRAAAEVPGQGEVLDPAPGSLSGTYDGILYLVANTDVRLRDFQLDGTLVVDVPPGYYIDMQQGVTITANAGPTQGLAICAPNVKLTTLGPVEATIQGFVLCGAVEIRGDGPTTDVCINGRVVAECPGGAFELRAGAAIEVQPGPPLAALPFGLTPGSWRLESLRLEER